MKETNDLREDVKKRLAAIEQLLAKEVESLNERLKTEQDDRSGAAKDLARQLDELTPRNFEKKTGQIDDQLSRGLREVRQQIHEQHQQLSDDLKRQADEILTLDAVFAFLALRFAAVPMIRDSGLLLAVGIAAIRVRSISRRPSSILGIRARAKSPAKGGDFREARSAASSSGSGRCRTGSPRMLIVASALIFVGGDHPSRTSSCSRPTRCSG